ncbi:MAG TPA: sigma-70 family RNA polymerase sigma factor [Solirubrobacteraceae bacterium]|nr:sigma-70 family RNA polymerase sigma factor [Solirubrobacteraceae bacterium]
MSSTEAERPSAPGQPSGEELEGAAFDRLFRECAGDVHGYAISLLRDAAAAEDVTALAFERLFRARARLDRAKGSPRAWLFAIARNAALDELRRRRRRPLDASEQEPPDRPGAGDPIERVERSADLRAALLELSPREREIVLLKFHGQLTNAELARALGISESNAGTRLHRALLKLRDACSELGRLEVA